jgi:hypothetical protein
MARDAPPTPGGGFSGLYRWLLEREEEEARHSMPRTVTRCTWLPYAPGARST